MEKEKTAADGKGGKQLRMEKGETAAGSTPNRVLPAADYDMACYFRKLTVRVGL